MTPHEQHTHFRRSLREAKLILAVFVVVFVVVVGLGAATGYREDEAVRARRAGTLRASIHEQVHGGEIVGATDLATKPVTVTVLTRPMSSWRDYRDDFQAYFDDYTVPIGYRVHRLADTDGFVYGEFVCRGQIIASPPHVPGSIPTVLGLPAWVFWTVLTPWVACIGITGWFCFRGLNDQPTVDARATPPGVDPPPAYRVEPTGPARS